MSQVNLTASMRSNLLSLQNISREVSSTQNKLSTGKKVNAAIDNPSSYYTATALNNRANDLNALLDSMGQAVSTIKAASTALETGAAFLEQAAAVANQALDKAVPPKSWFAEKAGADGAVVTTAQELKDAFAAGKKTIVVYGKIDYFNRASLSLKAGQKLVGTEYFTGYSGKQKFSQLNMTESLGMAENSVISDLSISSHMNSGYALHGADGALINNLDINFVADTNLYSSAIIIQGAGRTLTLAGKVNINSSSVAGTGMYIFNGATVNSTADLSISSSANRQGISLNGSASTSSTLNVVSGKINVKNGVGVALSQVIVGQKAELNVGGVIVLSKSSLDVAGKLNVRVASGEAVKLSGKASVVLQDGAEFAASCQSELFWVDSLADTIDIMAGSRLSVKGGATAAYLTTKENISLAGAQRVYLNDLLNSGKFEENTSAPRIDWENWSPGEIPPAPGQPENEKNFQQYADILKQYDVLMNDAAYKGANLLKDGSLKVNFNEKGSSDLKVEGKDMSSTALGFSVRGWQMQEEIAKSLAEISSALKSIRSFSAELGNNYSIITNRQDFTTNLINVLTEGADKLTLADMNEESANMLALQTRQQLAINSLSLASQAAQGVLKLF